MATIVFASLRGILRHCELAFGLLLACLSVASPVAAAGIVGDGTPDSCTETALDAALAGGGDVSFNCGPSPVTITVTNVKQIVADTSLDGGGNITLSGGGTTGIMFVEANVHLMLSNVTLSDAVHSGALDIGGRLTVVNSTFSNNAATSAILSVGNVSISNSTFVSNSSPGGGPGSCILNNGGVLTVSSSTFSNNSVAPNGNGGAIFAAGTNTVTDSTFSNNSATSGGAIWNMGTLTVSNSTFANNSAVQGGGAILNAGGQLTLINDTFVNNGAGTEGGSIFNNGRLVVKNTLLGSSTLGDNCAGFGSTSDRGHNLDSGASCGFHRSRHSMSNTDPKLDPAGLSDNGGPTQTIAVEAASPAINAGNKTFCRATPVRKSDQRGFSRPGAGSRACTIGAYEFKSTGVRQR
jgi:predicted outer membrane repeat protein